MQLLIPRKVKGIWDSWGLRLCITTSLLLQVFLLLFAPSRQRSRSNLLFRSVWAAYLLAYWVAAVAIGQITKSLVDPNEPEGNDDIFALWASFLLMHLGGPDGITSLSLEDNELWIRHLFEFILLVISAAYSFYLTLSKNKLLFPTILVFIGGCIKSAERTLALRRASLEHFGATVLPDPDPGPDYQEAVREYSTMRSVQFQTTTADMMQTILPGGVSDFLSLEPVAAVEGKPQKDLDEMKLLEVAYSLFGTFKRLIVGSLLTSKDRESSRCYFLQETATRAFRLVECELSFMYQVLHTKAVVIHGKMGYFLRFISIGTTILAFLVFLFIGKQEFGRFELRLTYALFIGAIVLDLVSVSTLIISDWILVVVKNSRIIKHVPPFVLRRPRWSGSVSQKSLISHCLAPKIGVHDLVNYHNKYGISETMKRILCDFSYLEIVPICLKEFIFHELKNKSKNASNLRDAIEACSQRGDSALLHNSSSYIKLKWSIVEFQYAESLLLWHLATELCYHHDEEANSSESETIYKLLAQRSCCSYVRQGLQNGSKTSRHQKDTDSRRICKLLSNYMFYLLVEKSTMLAPVLGNWNIVFQDTCAEARRFFDKYKLSCHVEACQKILSVEPKFRPAAVKGDRSKSLLFDACILAQQLLNEESYWEIMSRVWVEMLSYASINCRPFVHAQQLSKGGELLTFTWLLMNHLGLGMQFAHQEQQAKTKMETIIE